MMRRPTTCSAICFFFSNKRTSTMKHPFRCGEKKSTHTEKQISETSDEYVNKAHHILCAPLFIKWMRMRPRQIETTAIKCEKQTEWKRTVSQFKRLCLREFPITSAASFPYTVKRYTLNAVCVYNIVHTSNQDTHFFFSFFSCGISMIPFPT